MGVDSSGGPVIDPSRNVLDLVEAANLRQDDLRRTEFKRQDDLRGMESRHLRELLERDRLHAAELRIAETARIDAIRAVDVGAVQRAAEVQQTQATALATQQATIAETLRTQVAAAATVQATALAAALEPIQKDIADLRRVQYETAGGKTQVVEQRATTGEGRSNVGLVIAAVSIVVVLGCGFASTAVGILVAVFGR
jgi:hypothetical protein